MSFSVCASCLSRLRISSSTVANLPTSVSITQSSSFHNSAIYQNVLKKSKAAQLGKHRESRSAKIKKKSRDRPRPPPVGERKAQRKRIVLSNTNALEVSGLKPLTALSMSSEANVGQMVALEGVLLDQLREAKAFKVTQNWNMFRSPSTLLRSESVELGSEIEKINKGSDDQDNTVRRIVTGDRGSGKSIYLLQAMSMAFLNNWVVISIPDGQEFILNQSSYAPAPQSDASTASEQMYTQPQLAAELLGRVAQANSEVLSKLKPAHDHSKTLPRSSKPPKSLKDLALLGSKEPSLAPAVWRALWKELTESSRPPVLIAIDGIDHWMGPSLYRSADYNVIHAHQLTLIREFVDLLFSRGDNAALPNGGIVLGATTASNTPTFPTWQLLLRQLTAHAQGVKIGAQEFPMPEPYTKVDQKVFDLLQTPTFTSSSSFSSSSPAVGTQLTKLSGLTRPESKGLLDYFAKSGILKELVSELSVNEKWTLSGGGIVGELCKLGKRVRAGELETKSNQGVKMRT